MPTNYQDLAHLASAIQSIAVVIGLAVTAIWTLYTFNAFALRAKAKAELEELKRFPIVEVSMVAAKQTVPNDNNLYIAVDVTVTNKGSTETNIEISESPLAIARVEISGANELSARSEQRVPIYAYTSGLKPLIKIKLRPSLSEVYSFVARVDQPGIYLLTFRIPVEKKYKDPHAVAPWWGISRFVVVT
jgi:hypothetical protein